MLALERRNLILEKLQEEKRVVVSELSQLYSVSEETIRRDLDKLEKEGLATKSYGGAVINEDVGIDLPFNVRKNQNVQGKQKMAEIAASMVNDGDHIFLDASTTAVFVAKALKEKERLTKELARVNGMLANPNFVHKAPEKKIAEEKEKLENYTQMMARVEERLAHLSK